MLRPERRENIQSSFSYSLGKANTLVCELKRVHQLPSTDLVLPQLIHPLQDPFQPAAAPVHKSRWRFQSPLLQRPPRDLPELLRKLKLLGFRGRLAPALHKPLPKDGVHQRGVRAVDVGVHGQQVFPLRHPHDRRVLAPLAAQGSGADDGAVPGAVPRQFHAVPGVLADVGRDGGGVVVKDGVGAEGLEVVEVARRGRRDDPEPGELGELDAVDAGCGAAAVDEDMIVAFCDSAGEGESEGSIETLALWVIMRCVYSLGRKKGCLRLCRWKYRASPRPRR